MLNFKKKVKKLIFFIILINLFIICKSSVSCLEKNSGFPCCNFGIGCEVSPSGRIIGNVLYNPPILGRWLENLGYGYFSFESNNIEIEDVNFQKKKIIRKFPFAEIEFKDKRFENIVIKGMFFAPIKINDAFITSLPVLLAEFKIINRDENKGFDLTIKFHFEKNKSLDCDLITKFSGNEEKEEIEKIYILKKRIRVQKKSSESFKFILGIFHKNGYYANILKNAEELSSYVFNKWNILKNETENFSKKLPETKDKEINEYLRWYLTAGIMLTKLLKTGEILTMGYTELNQRDSFWTSYLHFVYWQELEKKMLEESAGYQREDGKIPTTILPIIEREDDIDINEYFILRIFRYYEWTKDKDFLKKMWKNIVKAIEFLEKRDKDKDGIPEQESYWADWKDVPLVEGRKYAPHFSLLYLAVLKKAKDYAGFLNDKEKYEEYKQLYESAYQKINKEIKDGGLWNGNYYVQVWYDGREDNHILQDQVVGILFDVVDEEKTEKIYKSLEKNKCKYGIRETYPYYPNSEGGDYHNGAVWPYLNFVDAFSRFKKGRIKEGKEILKTVGWADLVKDGDYLPHENIHAETGENKYHFIQAWNSVYFAAVYFGLLKK